MPETPYWLVMKNKEERATNVLRTLRKKDNVAYEIEQMKESYVSGVPHLRS